MALFYKLFVRVMFVCFLCCSYSLTNALDIKIHIDDKSELPAMGSIMYELLLSDGKMISNNVKPIPGRTDIYTIDLTDDQFLQNYGGNIIVRFKDNMTIQYTREATLHYNGIDQLKSCEISLYFKANMSTSSWSTWLNCSYDI